MSVHEIRMELKLTTGSTADTPEVAFEHAKEMLETYLKNTPLGTLNKTGLFNIQHVRSEVEVLSGKNKGDITEFED